MCDVPQISGLEVGCDRVDQTTAQSFGLIKWGLGQRLSGLIIRETTLQLFNSEVADKSRCSCDMLTAQ